jgi:mannosyltransferase
MGWRSAAALVATATAASAVASLLFLGREAIWLDEAYTVFLARLPAGEFWDVVVSSQANASLYYALLRGWIGLGTGETVVRLLSVLPVVAAVPLCYAVGSRLFGRRVGVTAAGLLAVNAFAIQYAQEARSYSLVLFLVLLTSYLFVRAVQDGGKATWVGYVVIAGMAGYAHFFAWFVILGHIMSLPFLDRRPTIRSLIAVYSGVAVLSAPLLLFLLTTSGDQIGWIPSLSVGRVARAIGQFAGARTSLGAAALVTIFGACVLFALRSLVLAWRRRERSSETWGLVLALAWLIIPIAGALAISVVKPIWVDKYLIVALPGLALTAAVGLWTWRPAVARVALVALVVASLSQVVVLHASDDKDDWRSATRYVLARSEPSDGIAFYRPNGRFPFGYYVGHTALRAEGVPTPMAAVFDRSGGSLTPGPRNIPLSIIADASGPFRRIWIVLNPALPGARRGVGASLEPEFSLAGRAGFRDVVVDLYVRAASPAQR